MQNKSKDYSKEWSEYKLALEANLKTELKGFCIERGFSYRSMQDWIYHHHYKVSKLKKEVQAKLTGASSSYSGDMHPPKKQICLYFMT